MLHITNGDSVSLADTGIGGDVLVWRDVLYEGPVPAGLALGDLTRLRGVFLDNAWPGDFSAVEALGRRDSVLAEFTAHEEVTLWFEHDLYDQLQLIQILDWLRGRESAATRVSLVCTDRYLGPLTGPQLADLWPGRHPVTPAELDLAAAAWNAFRSPDPMSIVRLLAGNTSAMPYLAGALMRHLQQFPSVENGLSRTERQILEVVAAGARDFGAIFVADQRREERIFMGDTAFARHLAGLVKCRQPLLVNADAGYELTGSGRAVLAGHADHVRINGINRWLGGVHLEGHEALWRWDERARRLAPH